MDSRYVVVKPLHTEKNVNDVRDANTYHFEVDRRATKTQIRHAIEELFPGRKVVAVRTVTVRSRRRRTRSTIGQTKAWKKAIVRLRAGDSIDIGY
jgi:large subunit ribosomal protein L23